MVDLPLTHMSMTGKNRIVVGSIDGMCTYYKRSWSVRFKEQKIVEHSFYEMLLWLIPSEKN